MGYSENKPLLLVDDNERILKDLNDIVAPLGYESIWLANTLDEALKLMNIGQIIISDLSMGSRGDEGTQLATEYRNLGGDLKKFGLHSTSFSTDPDKVEKLQRGLFLKRFPGIVLLPKLDADAIKAFLKGIS